MLLEQIDSDLKTALKEKNEIASSSLRNLKAAAKNAEIDAMKPLTDEQLMSVIAKKVKQHKDSIESFQAGGRNDLVEHEAAQMAVLQKYLPKAMDEAELSGIVSQTIAELKATPADFGKVMKEVVSKAKGRAEGNLISKLVKEQLAK
jgi:uncharacterized protein YqeY